MKERLIDRRIISEVINHCNNGLVPDQNYDRESYESEWFKNYFSFIEDEKLRSHLGDAFYQARFMYRIMSTLRLTVAKYKGIVKFQIIQYASICEAVMDYTINYYFKEEAEREFSVTELKRDNNTVAKDVKITKANKSLFLCYEKTKKGDLKRTRADFKTKFAVDKGIISSDLKSRFDVLYDLRNNVHILKAHEAGYTPKLREAKEAFFLMQDFVQAVKQFIEERQSVEAL